MLLFCEATLFIVMREIAVRHTPTRWALCALVAGTVAVLLGLVWKWTRIRKLLLWTCGVVLVWTVVTVGYGTGIHVPSFTEALRKRIDVPYTPDGETSLGLDDAGFIRVSSAITTLRRTETVNATTRTRDAIFTQKNVR